ncbi:Unknown protein sequence [Pseudomonas syringae pv. atrofaciens]|uniref:Lipoprotein n=1 Tax=Pseudomonas syringae TaxID=317 RepID=A0AB38BMR9_PSESX|nr:hypothetical protein PsyrH_06415 [Pseudomonas syringae pv. syringae HS191]KPW15143.1 Unknown protein sequence [Pseudomonas syringae pv. atrofaciens]KPY74968.1 Unknown protein sequence [Pseudomonas syringae pv. syringae]KPZ02196.1 Unknown protein sequence [Pseudomonas syringae pv. aptata]MBP1089391.1 hypothetical protein [Pseudomonas sp. PvP007]MBP1120791.1 hypothetical protein [Pseudomonas sp. PvP028]MBP1194778.1 hypothetical protein [Pseudomonas sp. PvP100]RMO48156.1 hypothetical protein
MVCSGSMVLVSLCSGTLAHENTRSILTLSIPRPQHS